MKKMRSGSLLSLIMMTLALIAAQCGAGAAQVPTEQVPAPAEVTEPSAEAEVPPAEEEVAATEESKAAPTVQESDVSVAKEQKGITVVTDEVDVSTPRTKSGGEYHDVDTSDAVSFHPYLTNDTTSGAYQGLVYSGSLLKLDEKTLEYEPYMAEKYEISEDGLTFTFYLRQGMKWSDGQPITAQDYKWTFDQVMDPNNEFPYLSQYQFIRSYEALDDYTIQAKIDEVYAPALGQIAGFVTPLPRHIWEELDWGDPERNPEINSPSVVSGPYKLVEWRRDQFARFEANENYWYHGAPNITNYTIEIVPDQDVAFEKLKAGEVDTSSLTPEQLQEAREMEHVNVYEWWPISAGWSYIGLNMREGFPTHDINVRHGLSYAIDKQLLTEEIWLGRARRMCSIYPETSWAHNPDVPCYDYDRDKAVEEFAKAGYTLQDGKMVDENGQQLKLKFLFGPNTSQTAELFAVTVQDYLAEIGIEVEIQGLEWASFLEALQSAEPDWDMFLGGWRSTPEPQTAATVWAEENIPSLNSVAYVNKEMEALFKEAGGTYDTELRKQKYGEIQQIIAEDSPYIFIAYQRAYSVQNQRVQGIIPTALGIGWNQEDWYIQEPQ
ncbi:MAG: hypothetical protein KJ077_29715 [Anaerolineae bacterium]|nr:hypothetical protein [Anaerolineae bacterium]